MTCILGIDPGSRVTGYGVIETEGSESVHVASGCVRVKAMGLALRLREIFEGVSDIITRCSPAEMAIEQVFLYRNADSALKLGQARGAAICAAALRAVPTFEYTPAQIKEAVVGRGNAGKTQVQFMVRLLLNLAQPPEPDAADALAVALCHANSNRILTRVAKARGWHGGRWR